jgi:hypothetical protein
MLSSLFRSCVNLTREFLQVGKAHVRDVEPISKEFREIFTTAKPHQGFVRRQSLPTGIVTFIVAVKKYLISPNIT